MREERKVTVNGESHTVVISDEREALLAASAAGRASVAVWDGKNGEFLPAAFAVESPEDADEEFLQLVREDLLSNRFAREKLPKGAVPHIVAYKAGNVLAGIDLVSGFFHVESEEIREAEKVYDDLFVFRGLDERDLENYFLVSEYIRLKKK